MDLTPLFESGSIIADLGAKNRDGVLRELISALTKKQSDLDPPTVIRAIEERERDGTTGIGMGVAIPHARLSGIKNILLAFGRSKEGIEFGSIDHKPVHLFFLLLVPERVSFLKILAQISKVCQSEDFCEALLECRSEKEIMEKLKKGN